MRLLPLAAIIPAALTSMSAYAADSSDTKSDPNKPLQEVVIFARGENLIGKADAASEGAVGGADLSVRPLLRVAELLEVVPGLIAAQHSGSGKANQYFLRGFNLDHGTDFTTYIDDVPMNLRTHGHGQGYLDLNGLIPEVVERVDYRKGPYRADVGDFSLAGASFMSTLERLDAPFVALESGQYVKAQAHELEPEIECQEIAGRNQQHHAECREDHQDRIFEPPLARARHEVE